MSRALRLPTGPYRFGGTAISSSWEVYDRENRTIATGIETRDLAEAICMLPLFIAERAARDVYSERGRQISKENYDLGHDDKHTDGSIAMAAAAYAVAAAQIVSKNGWKNASDLPIDSFGLWPWHPREYKPKQARNNLVRAAALLLAEIERLDRHHRSEPAGDAERKRLR